MVASNNKKFMEKFILFSFFVTFFFNCQSPTKKASEYQLTHSVYDMNDLMIGSGGAIIATDDHHIVGLDYNEDFFFYRQNVNYPDSLSQFGKQGQGPGEFIHPMNLQYISDDLIGCYDASSKEFSEITLDTHTRHLKVKTLSFTLANFRILKTVYGQYIGLGAYPDEMFLLYDSLGNKVKSFFEYPFKDTEEKNIKNILRAMAYQGQISSNLSKTKFAYAASYADIIHFYEIAYNDIQLIKKIENRFCEYIPEEIGQEMGSRLKPTNLHASVDLYSTDKYVYLLYSGKSFHDVREKAFESNQLRIYDWSGNLIKEVKLDVSCKNLCVSSDDQTMWAIAEIPEPTIVQFNLAELTQ
jgi:hypothetical protein